VRSVEHRDPIYSFACDRCKEAVDGDGELRLVAVEADDDIGLIEVAGKQMLLLDFCLPCFDGIMSSVEVER